MLEAQSTGPKYPDVVVQLLREDGNAFHVIGLVAKALRHNVSNEAAREWCDTAMDCASYNDLLALAEQTVEVA